MKILVTFFCFLIFGLLVLLATVDLEPFLTTGTSQVRESAVNSDKKGGNNTVVNNSPSLPRVTVSREDQTPDSEDANSSEPGLSRITTHQLIVTDKRETEKSVNKTKIQQQTLPHPADKTSAPQFNQLGE